MNQSKNENPNPESKTSGEKDVASFPSAVVSPGRTTLRDLLKGSYMWLMTLGCMMFAIGIVWWSMPKTGIRISIFFPDGHGLEVEDEIRFRGIGVGVVEKVDLSSDLTGVGVTVVLHPFAQALAREGTRFWIVRPELSLAGISGLDTAVGHKYIGVIPGDPNGDWKTVFEGLAKSPPDALEKSGMEIIVRGEKRYSVTSGSPVSYRGVVVGRVLSVGLSQDGRFVDCRVRIFDDSLDLVTTKTKFWASGGVDIEFSWTDGLSVEMESIETLAHGGVSILTTEPGGQPITPGHVFDLHASVNEKWFKASQQVRATKIDLRGALPMEMAWGKKVLFRTTDIQEAFVGAHVAVDSVHYLLLPSDRLVLPEKGIEDSLEIGIVGQSDGRVSALGGPPEDSVVTLFELPNFVGESLPRPMTRLEMRFPDQLESCIAVRADGELGDLTYLHYSMEVEEITEKWQVKNFDGDRLVWHGAPVLSAEDGKMIGVLVVGEHETHIETLTELMLVPPALPDDSPTDTNED